jgi:hypothetical protein
MPASRSNRIAIVANGQVIHRFTPEGFVRTAESTSIADRCHQSGRDHWSDSGDCCESLARVILPRRVCCRTTSICSMLIKRPRFHVHFSPTYGSWLNLVERWFAELTNKWIRRGVFRSVKELETAIGEFIEVHNEDPKPFVWTRTADQILDSIARYARHTSASHPSGINSRTTGTGD